MALEHRQHHLRMGVLPMTDKQPPATDRLTWPMIVECLREAE